MSYTVDFTTRQHFMAFYIKFIPLIKSGTRNAIVIAPSPFD